MAGAATYTYRAVKTSAPESTSVPRQAEIGFERKRQTPVSKENNRDLISSQHVQVKKSWENPGVYAWGSNSGRVVAPDSNETAIKTPRRIPYFDGQILRDLKLDQEFGAAVTEKGDLVQWGTKFSETTREPVATLKGKDLVKIAVSSDRIIALSSEGSVYSVPVSQADQNSGEKQQGSTWIPFWSGSPSLVSYRRLTPSNLGWGEKVVDVSSGLDHCLLLTSHGRVFSAAASTESFPSRGQLGVPGLTWRTRPSGPFDQPHELSSLKGFKISKVATGDFHSLVLDEEGRVFAFGDNANGQLGLPVVSEFTTIDAPSLLQFDSLYRRGSLRPLVTAIAAGGSNSYFSVDVTNVAWPGAADATAGPRVVTDTWSCGEGLYGSLGNGKWTHVSSGPTKVTALSRLSEYDEKTGKVVPIRLSNISVGSTHASAVMDNVTHLAATGKASENETNWGADIMFWGGNKFYQLGTGKRNNMNEPTYIAPLDGGEGDAEQGRKGEMHRFQITPRKTVRLGEGSKGRKVSVEQRVECGRYVTAVYSGT